MIVNSIYRSVKKRYVCKSDTRELLASVLRCPLNALKA